MSFDFKLRSMVTSPMCSRLGVEQVMRDKNRFEERKRGEKGRIEGEEEVKELEREEKGGGGL
jgi:hypothetical protein